MARSSHSRFTDEVYCTTEPSKSTIPVKQLDKLSDSIFRSNEFSDFIQGIESAEQLASRELQIHYPPKFHHKNKKFIYKVFQEQNYTPTDKSILITRWKTFYPIDETLESPTNVAFESNRFDYQKSKANEVDWYLNFADSDLFSFYAGPLLAQDELQVLECPELASLREYLTQAINTVGTRTVGKEVKKGTLVPTPSRFLSRVRLIKSNGKCSRSHVKF
jgi:hypothetical protein